jgi:hypothetical protein
VLVNKVFLDVSSLVRDTVSEMRSELLAEAKSEARQEFVASGNLTRNEMHALWLECRQASCDCDTLSLKMGDIARAQGLFRFLCTKHHSWLRPCWGCTWAWIVSRVEIWWCFCRRCPSCKSC